MKRILTYLVATAAFFMLISCSGKASYSAEKCKELEQKVKSGQALSDSECSEMLGQLQAIVDILREKESEIADDPEKKMEFAGSQEAMTYVDQLLGMAHYLDSKSDQLSEANKKKLAEIMKEFEQNKR